MKTNMKRTLSLDDMPSDPDDQSSALLPGFKKPRRCVRSRKNNCSTQPQPGTALNGDKTHKSINDAIDQVLSQSSKEVNGHVDSSESDIVDDTFEWGDLADMNAVDDSLAVGCDNPVKLRNEVKSLKNKVKFLHAALVELKGQVTKMQHDMIPRSTKSRQSPDDLGAGLRGMSTHSADINGVDRHVRSDTNAPGVNINIAMCESNHRAVTSDVALIVCRTLKETTKRRKNVIVTGLPEDSTLDDRLAFRQLCEYNLPVLPAIADNGCLRLGKPSTDGRPRRLLVRLMSDNAASELLQAAPLLRRSSDEHTANGVYINPDLTPAEARLAYEGRQRRRLQQQRQSATNGPSTGDEPAAGYRAPLVFTRRHADNASTTEQHRVRSPVSRPRAPAPSALVSGTLTGQQTIPTLVSAPACNVVGVAATSTPVGPVSVTHPGPDLPGVSTPWPQGSDP
jgi:hypothetical protein